MLDWWNQFWAAKGDEQPAVLAVRMTTAAVLGLGIAAVRTVARSEGRPAPGLRTTLLLLTVLTALFTEVIGGSQARAFGLAGILAVVRFRTVVEDTRDSAFVIFALAVGAAVGAGYFWTSVVGFGIISLVAVAVTRATGPPAYEAKLTVRVKGKATGIAAVREVLAKGSAAVVLAGADTVKDSTDTTDLLFRFRPYQHTDLSNLIDLLRAMPGVEKVAWEMK